MNDVFNEVDGFVKGKFTPWNIGFMNRFGEDDETQLDSDSADDLRQLWHNLHNEFDTDFDSILYIERGEEEL